MSVLSDQKPTWVRLIYSKEAKTKKWRNIKKLKKRIYSDVSVNSPGNSWSQSGRRKESLGGKNLQKRKVLSLEWNSEGVMDDESGESMELMEKVPLKELGDAELERLVRGWRREAGSWFRRRGEAYRKERSVIRRDREVFSCSRPWPWAYFLNGPNAAALITPTLIQQLASVFRRSTVSVST